MPMPIRMAGAGNERIRTKRAAPPLMMPTATTSGKRRRQRSRSFSMLADDVLIIIYRMLRDHPSSRALFLSVCRSWRAAVAAEPRDVPVLPWLLVSPRQVGGDRTRRARCLEDGAVMRISPRLRAVGRRLVGGYDGCWVVSCHPPPIRIVNLFSGAEVALSEEQQKIACPHRHLDKDRKDTSGSIVVTKIVFSESPTSGGCVMAAMTENCGVALCRVGCRAGGWTVHGCHVEKFIDIAFFNGDLYGLTRYGEKLVKFEVIENEHGAPMIIDDDSRVALRMVSREQSRDSCKEFAVYIVDLHGELAVAMLTWWCRGHEPFFKVYKFVDDVTATCYCCRNNWEEVTSLGDHALFLGETFSKAVHVPPTNNKHSGELLERNRIYYVDNCDRSLNSVVHGDAVVMTVSKHDGHLKCETKDRTSTVCHDEEINSVGYFMKCGSHDIMWLLPSEI